MLYSDDFVFLFEGDQFGHNVPSEASSGAADDNGLIIGSALRRSSRSTLHTELLLRRLKSESIRLSTFRNWQSPTMTPGELAKAGFFYFNDLDRVQCTFCLGIVQAWQAMDNALGEHRRLFPTCAFVMGLPCGNIPIAQPRGDLSADRRYVPATMLALPITAANIKESKLSAHGTTRTNLRVYSISNTHRSSLVYYQYRRDTFSYWPQGIGVSTMKLAAAGFFYTNVADQVACYSCELHLRGWDVEHSAFEEHYKWSPHCEFLASLTNLKIDEELERQKYLRSAEHSHNDTSTSSAVSVDSHLSRGGSTASATSDQEYDRSKKRVLKDLQSMQDSDDEGKEDTECKICFNKQRAVVFLPCGHFVCCSKCGLKITKCPICRVAIMSIVHVFM